MLGRIGMCLVGCASARGVVVRGQVILLMGLRVLIHLSIRLVLFFFVLWMRFWSVVILVVLFFRVRSGSQDLFDVMFVFFRSRMMSV